MNRKEFAEVQGDFKHVINNHIGEGKRFDSIDDLAFDLYKTTLDQEKKLIKFDQFKSIINRASSSFHMIDFSKSKL